MSGFVAFDAAALHDLFESPDGPVGKDLVRRGVNVQAAAKRSLRQHGTGRVYVHGHVSHQASSPGQPPATDTGRLLTSITQRLGHDERGLVERVGSDVEYTVPLERGTRTIEPRPFLMPALRAGGAL